MCIIVIASAAVIGCGGSVTRATANQRAAYNGVISVQRCKRRHAAFDVWRSHGTDVLRRTATRRSLLYDLG